MSSEEGMELYSGYLLKEGTLTLKVIRTYQNSAISKIVDLISNSGAKKSKADEFVSKFAKWYTPIVFISSLLVAVIGGAVTSDWKSWVILGLKMMVVACQQRQDGVREGIGEHDQVSPIRPVRLDMHQLVVPAVELSVMVEQRIG